MVCMHARPSAHGRSTLLRSTHEMPHSRSPWPLVGLPLLQYTGGAPDAWLGSGRRPALARMTASQQRAHDTERRHACQGGGRCDGTHRVQCHSAVWRAHATRDPPSPPVSEPSGSVPNTPMQPQHTQHAHHTQHTQHAHHTQHTQHTQHEQHAQHRQPNQQTPVQRKAQSPGELRGSLVAA